MDPNDRSRMLRDLEQARERVIQLEGELSAPAPRWRATSFYWAYYATTGFLLGMVAAGASLLVNIIGSAIVGQHPLQIIQVYLTFPLGEQALSKEFSTGLALAIGCCLYIATGALLGIPFQIVLGRFTPNSTRGARLALATVLGLAIWLFNFYAVLSWLQPLLFGGNWMVDPAILPPWVAAATHLVFAWTMALIFPWGAYVPYRPLTEVA